HTTRRADVATGVVLGTAGGLAALFLYLEATGGTTTGSTQQILFGSIFALDTSVLPFVGALGALATALTLLCYRPLVLSSVDAEIARARGIPLRLVGIVYMVSLALAVALSSLSVGAVLSTALLVGPAACAIKVARSLSSAIALAVLIAVATTEVGILASYDSYYWVASHDAMPVSFFVVAAVLVAYAICSALAALSARVVTSGRRALGD
ncbi:MAG: metal ABC transporter permease, partial [Acidimicrobiales bacterium]